MKKIEIEGRIYKYKVSSYNAIEIEDFDEALLDRRAALVSAVCNVFKVPLNIKDIQKYKAKLQKESDKELKAFRVKYPEGHDFLIMFKPLTKVLIIEVLRINQPAAKAKFFNRIRKQN